MQYSSPLLTLVTYNSLMPAALLLSSLPRYVLYALQESKNPPSLSILYSSLPFFFFSSSQQLYMTFPLPLFLPPSPDLISFCHSISHPVSSLFVLLLLLNLTPPYPRTTWLFLLFQLTHALLLSSLPRYLAFFYILAPKNILSLSVFCFFSVIFPCNSYMASPYASFSASFSLPPNLLSLYITQFFSPFSAFCSSYILRFSLHYLHALLLLPLPSSVFVTLLYVSFQ